MSNHIMNAFGIPRVFRKSKEPHSRNKLPRLTLDVKGPKVQHILGISTRDLNTARSQSLSSSSTIRPLDSSISDATTASVSSTQAPQNDRISTSARAVKPKSSSIILRDEAAHESAKDRPTSVHLTSFPSSSTLHSHYDRSKAPLSISQQTSNSSSRDFALRKGTTPVIPRRSQEMEHAVQMLFMKSSKPRPKESKNPSRIDTSRSQESASSSNVGNHAHYPLGGNVPITSLSSHSLPLNPPLVTPSRKVLPSSKRNESHQSCPPPVNNFAVRDPYAKINVRRPKVGAKHWFDDVEDEWSEEEINKEPVAGPNFVNEVEHAFAANVPSADRTSNATPARSFSQPATHPRRTHRTPVPRVVIPPGSARALLTEHKPLSHKVSFQERKPSKDGSSELKGSRKQVNILAAADLSKQSILCLSSSSDDEDETDTSEIAEASKTPIKTQIRESLAGSILDESDVEVGLAKTIKANSGEPIVRTTHSRTETLRSPQDRPSPIDISTRTNSRHASYLLDPSTENDMSESDIITSFPATPSDTASFRTSIRSSIFSDNGSLASTRPMLVTKQEEKLLAAMRRKKAAMRQAERETDRDGALRVLESGSQNSSRSIQRSRSYASEQAKLDHRLSNRYVPTRSQAHRHSLSGDDHLMSSMNARESGTTFEMSVDSQRNSQATVRTIFSEDSDSPYSAYPRSDATVISPTRPHFRNPAAQERRANRRDTYHSSTSTASSNGRSSHVVMLDGLDEALSREHVPSQLFMEAPFIGWERAGLTSAR